MELRVDCCDAIDGAVGGAVGEGKFAICVPQAGQKRAAFGAGVPQRWQNMLMC